MPRRRGARKWARAVWVSEARVEADRHAARQDLHEDGHLARRGPVAHTGAEHPAGDHVRLPVRLRLHAGDTVVERQELERPDPGVLVRVVDDEGGDEARLQRDLAAREALATLALEPLVGIAALVGARPAEGDLEQIGAQSGDHRGVDRLPEGVAELVIVAVPQGAADLDGDDAVLERLGILACPDAALIVLDDVIEARARAARAQQQEEKRAAKGNAGRHARTLRDDAHSRALRRCYVYSRRLRINLAMQCTLQGRV